MKVQCPSCKRCCHTTNDLFDPDIMPNGGMVDLLNPWKSYGWGKFGGDSYGGSAVMAGDMLCPLCEAALAPSGRLILVDDGWTEVPKEKTLEQKNQELIDDFEDSLPQERIEATLSDKDGDPTDAPISSLTHICPVCGWEGKTEPALKRHMTMRH